MSVLHFSVHYLNFVGLKISCSYLWSLKFQTKLDTSQEQCCG